MVLYRSHMHKGLKRNYQLMPGAQWLELLCSHIPDRFKQLVRYTGWYSNRVRRERARRGAVTVRADGDMSNDSLADAVRARSTWARLIYKVYEVDVLECPRCKGRTPCIRRYCRCPDTGSCRWNRAPPRCRAAVSACCPGRRSAPSRCARPALGVEHRGREFNCVEGLLAQGNQHLATAKVVVFPVRAVLVPALDRVFQRRRIQSDGVRERSNARGLPDPSACQFRAVVRAPVVALDDPAPAHHGLLVVQGAA